MSAIGSGFEDERQRFRQKRLKDDIRITVDGGINFDDDTRPRVANTNRQVAIVVYFWWRQHKEKHYQIPADSLEVQYSRGLLGGGTYGEVFHALVGGDGRGTRAVAKRAKDGRTDPDDPTHDEDEDHNCALAYMDVTCLEQHLELLDQYNKAYQYLQVEAFMNDLVTQLCPDVAAPYIGMCRRGGMRWLVWEYAGEDSLQALLDRSQEQGSLRPLAEALHIADFEDLDEGSLQRVVNEVGRQLLECCRALEAAGIAHRDVKPDNLIVVDGRLRLIDFGSAAAMGLQGMAGYDYRTAPCDPCYAPPEQFIDEEEWAKYDVYCVGLTLVRLLFQPLWGGQHWSEFSDSYKAAGYNLDRWLLSIIRRDPAVRTRGPSPWMRALHSITHRFRSAEALDDASARGQKYVELAAESCSLPAEGRRLTMCSMKLGLEVLNVRGGGVCWDSLRRMLARSPRKRISATEALERLSSERVTAWPEWVREREAEAERVREAHREAQGATVYVWDGWDVHAPPAAPSRSASPYQAGELGEESEYEGEPEVVWGALRGKSGG